MRECDKCALRLCRLSSFHASAHYAGLYAHVMFVFFSCINSWTLPLRHSYGIRYPCTLNHQSQPNCLSIVHIPLFPSPLFFCSATCSGLSHLNCTGALHSPISLLRYDARGSDPVSKDQDTLDTELALTMYAVCEMYL